MFLTYMLTVFLEVVFRSALRTALSLALDQLPTCLEHSRDVGRQRPGHFRRYISLSERSTISHGYWETCTVS